MSQNATKIKELAVCKICGYSYNHKSCLSRHVKNKHNIVKKLTISKFQCTMCTLMFLSKGNLQRHLSNVHKLYIPRKHRKGEFVCNVCGLVCDYKSKLLAHLRLEHGFGTEIKRLSCPIDGCQELIASHRKVLYHVEKQHGIAVEMKNLEFSTREDFESWLCEEKERSQSSFQKKTDQDKRVTRFICNRSGFMVKQGNMCRFHKKPSLKTGRFCPARIISSFQKSKVVVKYFMTHLGHLQAVHKLRLSKDEKTKLASQLKAGISVDRILEDARKCWVPGEEPKRIHLLKRRDLYNIIRDFKIDKELVHYGHATGTAMWVSKQKELGEDCPMLLCKEQETPVNAKTQVTMSITEKIRHVLDSISVQVPSLQDEDKREILSELKSILLSMNAMASKAETPESNNKRLTKQGRFYSVKKSRIVKETELVKPSAVESRSLKEMLLVEPHVEVISSHVTDHTYTRFCS